MALFDHISALLSGNWLFSLPVLLTIIFLALLYASFALHDRPYPGFPIARLDDPPKNKLFDFGPSRRQYQLQPVAVTAKGRHMTDNLFQVRAGLGYKICIPHRYAEEVLKNSENAKAREMAQLEFYTHIPGFESMKVGTRTDGLFADIVRINLTQSLALITDAIIDEAEDALPRWFPADSTSWTTIELKKALLDIVARLSTRVFAGRELARNEEYLHIAKENAIDCFMASHTLHVFPLFLRSIVHWVLPQTRNLRRQNRKAHELLKEKVEEAVEWSQKGEKAAKTASAFQWAIDIAKGRPWSKEELVLIQLELSLAAIHNTTDAVTSGIIQMCQNPDVVQPLREEIINVLKEEGWSKVSLYKMKLLDSFMKETQRLQASHGNAAIGRFIVRPTTLSDGTYLAPGSLVQVLQDHSMDPTLYPNPEKFDLCRYLNKNQAFATVNSDLMVFGYGKYACPGRFFAANEIKIIFAFLLLQYDFKLVDGKAPEPFLFESQFSLPPDVKVMVRRREAEIDVARPKGEATSWMGEEGAILESEEHRGFHNH